MTPSRSTKVYKVFRAQDWVSFQRDGRFLGSADDLRDGFIHLSSWRQLAGTLERHFSRPEDCEVVVAAFEAESLGSALRWERSRGGEAFPHFYGGLLPGHSSGNLYLARSVQGTYGLPPEEPE